PPPINEELRGDLTAFLISHYKEYSALIIINRRGSPLYKLEPEELRGAPSAFYTDTEQEFTSEDIVSAPEAFATAKDQIFVSEVQQVIVGPQLQLIPSLPHSPTTSPP